MAEKNGKAIISNQETICCLANPISVPFRADRTKRIKIANIKIMSTNELSFGKLKAKTAI
jgi:hypothetical protein